jgi:uncharacterized peroxidase-related enzyme
MFPSLPAAPQLSDVLKRFPHTAPPLLDYHDRLLRDPSPLTVGERELIAAYVSGLNACDFCHGAHIIAARVHGVAETVFGALLADIDSAPVEDRLKPLLRYVRKLTVSPAKISPSDAQKVFDAGWDEQALFDAISVCALFNMMNRIVMGTGVGGNPRLNDPEDVAARAKRMGQPGSDPHSAEASYSKLLSLFNIGDKRV